MRFPSPKQSYASQSPVAGRIQHYKWEVFRQQTWVSPTGAKHSVECAEGPHKRSVHWIPALQRGACPPPAGEGAEASAAAATTPAAAPVEGPEGLMSLTVVQLKAKCSARGLAVSGRKSDLVQRLLAVAPEPKAASALVNTPGPTYNLDSALNPVVLKGHVVVEACKS